MKTLDFDKLLEELRPRWRAGRNAWSMRRTQREAALWIAMMKPSDEVEVPVETLRSACKHLKVYDTALFSYYMNDRHWSWAWFRPVMKDGKRIGWNLTRDARSEAEKLFA